DEAEREEELPRERVEVPAAVQRIIRDIQPPGSGGGVKRERGRQREGMASLDEHHQHREAEEEHHVHRQDVEIAELMAERDDAEAAMHRIVDERADIVLADKV